MNPAYVVLIGWCIFFAGVIAACTVLDWLARRKMKR